MKGRHTFKIKFFENMLQVVEPVRALRRLPRPRVWTPQLLQWNMNICLEFPHY